VRPDRTGGSGRSPAEGARPLGIRLLIWLYWFWAGATVLLVLALLSGDSPILLQGRPVPREEARALVLPVLVPLALAVAGAALALGQRRRWARLAALFPFVLMVFAPVLMLGGRSGGLAMVAPIPIALGLAWYLYRRPGPRAYFAAPAGRGETGHASAAEPADPGDGRSGS
jgi:uncharacterized membrane protein